MSAPFPSRSHVRKSRLAARRRHGFSLVELMIVVIAIGILAVAATPSMIAASAERRVFSDAASIAEIFRQARTRAIGRGAATVVKMTPGANSFGRFELWEAQVTTNGPLGIAGTPMSTCSAPTVWTGGGATAYFLDAVDLNGTIETQLGVKTSINDPTTTNVGSGWVCVTPLGRFYYSPGGAAPTFVPGATMYGSLQIAVSRQLGGNPVGVTRTVVVPPSGATRIVSK